MNRMVNVGLGVLVGVMLMPRAALSQGTTAGSITGVVRDALGAVLPGVTVEAASPALIEKVRTTVTDDEGQYRIIELRPGTYRVTFSLPGFRTLQRENLELPPNFTATVNAELSMGEFQETVTVSGQSPLVDIQNVSQQERMTKALLDAVPTSKGILAYAALIPGAIVPLAAQDVGGSKGEISVRVSIHGGRQTDQKLLQDGMRYNNLAVSGTGRGFFINPLAAQEVVVNMGAGGSAEYATGGSQIDLIPKDGGNRFSGGFFGAWTGHQLQSNNLTADLRARGVSAVNGIRKIYDVNGMAGGPIIKNTLWFMTAHRRHGKTLRTTNLYYDANFSARTFGAPAAMWKFTPDLSRPPVDNPEFNRSSAIRFTWQVAAKHKVTGSYGYQANHYGNLDGTASFESGAGSTCPVPKLTQATWTHPATNRLLFSAGFTHNVQRRGDFLEFNCRFADSNTRIQITELTPRFVYGGNGFTLQTLYAADNGRFSTSYVTGSHNVKAGLFWQYGFRNENHNDRDGIPFSYTFTNGVPTSLTQYVSPIFTNQSMAPELGLYAQDQWTINRLTVNLGLRYEYLRAYIANPRALGGALSDPRTFDRVNCVPCWHDLNPRMGVSYDLFGDGKTALKAGLGRYTGSVTIDLAAQFDPVNASVNNTTRAWTDRDSDFFPDCDLRNPDANGECGPMANRSFGQLQIRNRPDPDWTRGWSKRPYNWQASVSLDRQLWPGVAMNAGYYRTWFGNFTVSDNQFVTPADFDPYCITAPIDSRLGGVSGGQICGLYDIKPEKFGLVDNVVTLAKKFGKQTEVYNGADVTLEARLPKGGMLTLGWNVGNSQVVIAGGAPNLGSTQAGNTTISKTRACFVVDSPQALYNCETGNPYHHRFKLNGSYPLPWWGLQAAAVFQSLPGAQYGASLIVPTAQIAPSLGRNLAGGTRTVSLELLRPLSAFLDERVSQLDVRVSKIFQIKAARIQANVDIYNVLNGNTVLQTISTYGSTWLTPTQVLDARLLKFSAQLDF